MLRTDTGRGDRARCPKRNCRPGGRRDGRVQPRSYDADLGARLRRQAIFARRDVLARVSRIAKPLVGGALVGVGAFVLTGFDKVVEASLTRAMPGWLVTVTTRL